MDWKKKEKKKKHDQWGFTDNSIDGANLHMMLLINLLKGISNATPGASV